MGVISKIAVTRPARGEHPRSVTVAFCLALKQEQERAQALGSAAFLFAANALQLRRTE